MRTSLDAWRRQYFKAHGAYKDLVRNGAPFSFTMSGDVDSGTMDVNLGMPPEAMTLRFVAAMRPFTQKHSPLHWEAVWEDLKEHSPPQVTPDEVVAMEAWFARIRHGDLELVVNDTEIRAERLAAIVADGSVFDDATWARNAMRELHANPVLGPMAWHAYYSFNLNVRDVLSTMFDRLDAMRREQAALEEISPGSCIFCLSGEGPFKSREHVYPEALGNWQFLLPRGAVCDPCNNANAAIEKLFVEFEPIAMLRTQFVPLTKAGNFPKAQVGGMHIERRSPRQLLTTISKGAELIHHGLDEDGRPRFTVNTSFRPKARPHDIARALSKMALASLAFERGVQAVRSAQYDAVRAFIKSGGAFPNTMLMAQRGQPSESVRVELCPSDIGTVMGFDIFGLRFIVALEEHPRLCLVPQLAEAGWKAYPLDSQCDW